MRTVELFAGVGGFRLAVERAGWSTLWANDVCPKACSVYRDRFGEGEIRGGDFAAFRDAVPAHDLLTAGFPCQPFSSAGKKKGIRDTRGTLFEGIVEILRRHQPAFFVLENVKRLLAMEEGRHFAAILAALARLDYALEWRLLNAAHFGLPQNRERVFLIGVRREGQPAAVRLASALDLACLDGQAAARLFRSDGWQAISRHGKRFPTWGLAGGGRMFAADLEGFSFAQGPVTLGSVLQPDVAEEFDFTEATLGWIRSNTIVNRFVRGVEVLSNQRGGARMGYTIYGVNGLAPTLTSATSRHYERYKVGARYRRLTNVEYARIQGFPDDHCRAVPLRAQYALLGNAVPPAMAAWVLGRLTCRGVLVDIEAAGG
jgi:DNA (cytosine-5)-methyltransferase 1